MLIWQKLMSNWYSVIVQCTIAYCDFPSCGSLDGDMKNARDICYAEDAGYIKFDGLPGSIKTGCPETPDFKSQYYKKHKPQAWNLSSKDSEADQDLDVPIGSVIRSGQKMKHPGNPVAEMILSKKTRRQTYYKIVIHCVLW